MAALAKKHEESKQEESPEQAKQSVQEEQIEKSVGFMKALNQQTE